MEIEAKFAIPSGKVFKALRALRALEAWTLEPRLPRALVDRYYDTADYALAAAGATCRVRTDGETYTLTVKTPSTSHDGVLAREEHEVALPGDLLPLAWPAGAVRDIAHAWAGGAPLQPLFTLNQVRYPLLVMEGDVALAEITLDAVTADLEGLPETRTRILEVELRDGDDPARLQPLLAALRAAFPLQSEQASKVQWAMGLLARVAPLKPAPLAADEPMAEAGRKLLATHLRKLRANTAGACAGDEIEALHDMRVASRRLRAALRLVGPYFRGRAISGLSKELRALGGVLGAVRDGDVLLDALRAYADAHPEIDLSGLTGAWEVERDTHRAPMTRHLSSKGYLRFQRAFVTLVNTPGRGVRAAQASRVCEALPALLWQHYSQVRAYAPAVTVEAPSLEALHALRIACKRLRYALEFFRPVLPDEAGALITTLVAAQDHLGTLHDTHVALGRVGAYLEDHPHDAGATAYLAYLQAQHNRLITGVPAIWETVDSPAFRETLGQIGAAV